MKKVLLMALAVGLLTACSQVSDEVEMNGSKDVQFNLEGDFTFEITPFTRSLEADGKSMTDVWIFDYVGGSLVQQIHQVSTDDGFGSPTLTLSPGTHHLYCATSRGNTPVVDNNAATITFTRPSDTFWKDYEITVSPSTPASVSVACDRIVSKLKIVVTDAVPEGAATFNVTPHTWYYGFNYTTGAPVATQTDAVSTISIPSSVIGQTDTSISIFTFSATTAWNSNVDVNSKNGNGDVLGNASVANVPFERNRITVVSGVLYADVLVAGLTLNTDWEDDYEMTF